MAPPKTSSQPTAWLVPSSVSGTISRCCGRKHGSCSRVAKAHGAHRRLSGMGEPQDPVPPLRVLGPGSRTLHPIISLHLCFSSWNSFPRLSFFKHQSVWEPPKGLLRWVHGSPIILILLLQRASCSQGASPYNQNPTGTPTTEGSRHTTLRTTSTNIPHPTLNSGNARKALQDCFTVRWWNGLSSSFLSGSYFPLFKLDKLYLAC